MPELITERIRRNATELRLHAIAQDPDELIDRAQHGKLGYREFLDLILESEAGVLEGRRYQARLKMAGLPHHKHSTTSTSASSPIWTPNASPSCARCGSCNARSAASSSAHPASASHTCPWDSRWKPSPAATSSATRHSTTSSVAYATQTRSASSPTSSGIAWVRRRVVSS
jgi:hypothetical protein